MSIDKPDQPRTSIPTQTSTVAAASSAVKKPWHAPRVISQEPLEAVAAACDVVGALGKAGPPICATLGS